MLGAGYIGQVHARNLVKISGVEIVAICDPAGADGMLGIVPGTPKVFEDFKQMLSQSTFDVLYVSLPPFAHNGQVEEAAAKGIHIFIEKPIALDTQKAAMMVAAIRKAGVVSQVGYHMRFGGAVQELQKMVSSGVAGTPTLFDGRYECNSLHSPWWRDRSKSGGQVFEQIIHIYDLAMLFLGAPETVVGFAANLCHKEEASYTVEDTSASAIRFQNGAMANISGSNCAVPMNWIGSFTVVCKNVTAYFKDANNAEFVLTGGTDPDRKQIMCEGDPYFKETEAFIAAVCGEGPAQVDIEQGFKSLRLVEAVMQSADRGGEPVKY